MSVRKFRQGVALLPVSADPASPVEGQLQYSDGSARDVGLHVFSSGSWLPVGDAAVPPKTIATENPTLDSDLTNWTLVSAADGNSTATMTRNTTDPLAGQGDLRIETVSTSIVVNGVNSLDKFDSVEYPFSLVNNVEKGQKIEVSFDLDIEEADNFTVIARNSFVLVGLIDVSAGGTEPFTLKNLDGSDAPIDGSSSIDVNDLSSIGSATTFGTGGIYSVNMSFTAQNSTSTDYKLVILTFDASN